MIFIHIFKLLFLFLKEAMSLIHNRMMIVYSGNKKWYDSGYLLKVDLTEFSEFEYMTKYKIKVQKIMKSLK